MRIIIYSLLFFIIALSLGCSKERIYEGMYEGLKARQRIVGPPNETNSNEPSLSYRQYKNEKNKLGEKDDQKK